MRVCLCALLLSLVIFSSPALAVPLIEAPSLIEDVKSGALPPIEERVPVVPATVEFSTNDKEAGLYGGELRLLMGKQKDTRMMTVYGYARLISLDEKRRFVPDILERFEVREGREFTFYLRKGHKWSDGKPFTAEDFRYYWEDIATNEKLSPGGLPKAAGRSPPCRIPILTGSSI